MINSKKSGKERVKRYSVWIILLTLFVLTGFGHDFSAQARAETIRVGVFELNGFFQKDENGELEGYGVDYLNKIAEQTGWEYEYIWAANWDECVQLLRDGKVDIIAPAGKNEEREQEFAFSDFMIGTECGALLTLNTNDALSYEDFSAFSGIKIGCVGTLIFKDSFYRYADAGRFKPDVIEYKDTKSLMAALNAGEVDAVVANLFTKTDTMKVLAKFGASSFYFMTQKDNTIFLKRLNNALHNIKVEFTDFDTTLMNRYYPAFNYVPMTKDELEFVKQEGILRVGYRTDMDPVSYSDEKTGEFQGITRDILDRISEISGLVFTYVPLPVKNVDYACLQEKQIDLISAVEYNSVNARVKGLRLSNPYLNSKKVFVCDKDYIFSPQEPMKLALSTGSLTLADAIKLEYPNFEIVFCDTAGDCFEAVRKGKADALIQNQYAANTNLAKPVYSELKIVPDEKIEDSLCLSPILYEKGGGMNEDLWDDRLISILNKSIQQISDDELSRIIITRTSERQYRYNASDFIYQYRYPLGIIVFLSLIFICAALYTVRMKKASMRLITESEMKLRNIANNINGGVVVLRAGEELQITYANEGFLELLGCSKEEYEMIKNQAYVTYIHPEDAGVLKKVRDMSLEEENQISVKLRIMRKDGTYIPTLFNGTLSENADGVRELYCVIMDITEQNRLIEELYLEHQKYGIVLQNAETIIFEVDCKENRGKISNLFQKKFGWKIPENIPIHDLPDMLEIWHVYKDDRDVMKEAIRKVYEGLESSDCVVRLLKADGGSLWCRIARYPMLDTKGRLVCVVGRVQDLDAEVREKKALENKSRMDALTGLLNKQAFYQEAEDFLARADVENSVLVFIDVDNFKQVNDKLGHIIGDEAIQETARRLQAVFPGQNSIARFGGDEFCVLLKEISLYEVRDTLFKAVEQMRNVYRDGDEMVVCTASMGAVCTYGQKRELDELLALADQSLYRAKENGKDQFVLYEEIT